MVLKINSFPIVVKKKQQIDFLKMSLITNFMYKQTMFQTMHIP